VQRRGDGGGDVPADDDVRVARLETEIGGLLVRAHLVGGMAPEVGHVGLVPWLPGVDPALEAGRHRLAEPVDVTQVAGVASARFALRYRPRGRVVEDLKHLEAVSNLNLRRFVVGGGWFEALRLGLNVTPAQAVAHPVDPRERRQVSEALLLGRVVRCKPRCGRVDADGRVLRHGRREFGQDRRRGPRETLVVISHEFDPVPADSQPAHGH